MLASSFTMPHHAAPSYTLQDVIDGTLKLVADMLDVRLSMSTRIDGNASTLSGVIDRLDSVREGTVFPLEDTFCLQMLRTGQACFPDIDSAGPAVRRVPAALELDLRSYIGAPISLADGRIFGTLCAAHSTPRTWTADELATLRLLARLLGHEVDVDLRACRVERRGHYGVGAQLTDELTGLIDRPAFENQLRIEERRLRRYGGVYGIAVLHVSDLREIVLAAGQPVADQLLQGLANTLMLSSRLVDCCARLDDGCFAVLFPETPAGNIPAWQGRIEAAITTWNLLHPSLGVELGFGIGIADSEEGDDYQAVLELATARMRGQMVSREEGMGVRG